MEEDDITLAYMGRVMSILGVVHQLTLKIGPKLIYLLDPNLNLPLVIIVLLGINRGY
jgi:hypothetical protein